MAKPTTPGTDEDRIDPETGPQQAEATETVEEAEVVEETAEAEAGDTLAGETEPDSDTAPAEDAPAEPAEAEATPQGDMPPETATAPAPEPSGQRGPGFLPLVLGGVIAAGLGYGAAYLGFAPDQQDNGTEAALDSIEATLSAQDETLSALTTRTDTLEEDLAALPPVPDPVDLAPLNDNIDALGARIDSLAGQVSGLTDRVAYLESLPLGEEQGADNSAAVAAAVAQLRDQIQTQAESLAAQQEESGGLIEQIRSIAAEAEDNIAAAQERATARVEAATAQAALGQLRIAVASGAPFAGTLGDLDVGAEVPEALTAAAETGVATLDRLQASFPAAARAALPVALRETAGEDAVDRFTAFLQSQIGGRSLEPRDGDDPDAMLSRAEAALRAGDLSGAIAELDALPDSARAEMTDWTAAAQTRLDALAAVDALAAALDGTN